MSERLLRLGVPPSYFAHAKHFEGVFRGLGWSQPQIDAAIKFGAEFKGKAEDLYPQFVATVAERHGIEAVDVDLAGAWREQVVEQGIDNMPKIETATPSKEEDQKRLAEIREDMRNDGKYWRDEAMRDEHLEILERLGAETDAPYTPAPTGDDAARKAEIQNIMKTDSDHYWRSESMQREYREILSREQTPDARLEEIRQMRTADPNAYDQNHDLQREELALIGQTQGGGNGPEES